MVLLMAMAMHDERGYGYTGEEEEGDEEEDLGYHSLLHNPPLREVHDFDEAEYHEHTCTSPTLSEHHPQIPLTPGSQRRGMHFFFFWVLVVCSKETHKHDSTEMVQALPQKLRDSLEQVIAGEDHVDNGDASSPRLDFDVHDVEHLSSRTALHGLHMSSSL